MGSRHLPNLYIRAQKVSEILCISCNIQLVSKLLKQLWPRREQDCANAHASCFLVLAWNLQAFHTVFFAAVEKKLRGRPGFEAISLSSSVFLTKPFLECVSLFKYNVHVHDIVQD